MQTGVEGFLSPRSWLWLVATSSLVCGLSLLYLWWQHPRYGRNTGPTILPVVGCLPWILFNLHRHYDWSTAELAKTPTLTMRVVVPGLDFIETSNPANVEYILKSNFENYPKGEYFRSIFSDLLGLGIFNADGSVWKQQRKVASPEFSTRTLRELAVNSVQTELAERLLPCLDSFCDSDTVVDLQDLLLRFTFDTISQLAFGTDPGCLKSDLPSVPFAKAFDDAVLLSTLRPLSTGFPPWQVKRFFNVGSERKLRRSLSVVDAFAFDLIRTRRQERADGGGDHVSDLISRFMRIADDFVESPEVKRRIKEDPRSKYLQPSDLFLRDIVISFILAGRDTSASGLSWFFWLLSRNPKVEVNICNEIEGILASRRGGRGDPFSLEELKGMHYLHAALIESMRLYPPVPNDSKQSAADDVFPDGTVIPKGTLISFHIYAMGRNEKIWGSDCLAFQPERFLRDGIFVAPNPFDYPVFLGGPRMCLGMDMGMMQMKLVGATLMSRYEFVVGEGYRANHDLSMTMKIVGGLPVHVRRRKG